MSYFVEAFGGFNPQVDYDASMKMVLDSLFDDDRIRPLIEVILPEGTLGGVEGQPGWTLERRCPGHSWPNGAEYRAYVDPTFYSLAHPEFFCTRSEFLRYVSAIVRVYKTRHPERASSVRQIEILAGEDLV